MCHKCEPTNFTILSVISRYISGYLDLRLSSFFSSALYIREPQDFFQRRQLGL